MNVLLTNDDGIYADGLWALFNQFRKSHSVTVVAPDRERSAVSHGITLHEPLRTKYISVNGGSGYAVNGTPADCIKLGIRELLDKKPDIVISGINLGANVGVNINYSGTVAAAREAALYGCCAIAISIHGHEPTHLQTAAQFAEKLATYVHTKGLPFGTLLNVNVPDKPSDKILGIQICRQGISQLSEYFEKRVDPRNRLYYWQGTDIQSYDDDLDIDSVAINEDYISITPIRCDMTDYDMVNHLKTWNLNI